MVRSEYKMNKTNSRTTEYSIRHRPINAIISPPVSRNRRYVKRIGRIRSHFHFNCKSYMNSSMNWKASISLSLSLYLFGETLPQAQRKIRLEWNGNIDIPSNLSNESLIGLAPTLAVCTERQKKKVDRNVYAISHWKCHTFLVSLSLSCSSLRIVVDVSPAFVMFKNVLFSRNFLFT